VWHASIAVRSGLGLAPWARCGLKTREIVRRTVLGLLVGVGTGDTRRDRSDHVLHARRRLNEREVAMLSPEWCAIPAVDVAGGDLPW
jgi:hypothetical protein